MLKKLLKLLLNKSSHKKKWDSSDGWKRGMKSHRHSHLGHGHYKRKHKSGSFFSSFFSS